MNLSSEEDIKEQKQKEKLLLKRDKTDLKFILQHQQGRRVIWKYLEMAGINRSSFTGDVNSTLFNEGMRNMGLRILADVMETQPEAYLKMINDAKSEAEKEKE